MNCFISYVSLIKAVVRIGTTVLEASAKEFEEHLYVCFLDILVLMGHLNLHSRDA